MNFICRSNFCPSEQRSAQQSRAHVHQPGADSADQSLIRWPFSLLPPYPQVLFYLYLSSDNTIWNLTVKMTTHGHFHFQNSLDTEIVQRCTIANIFAGLRTHSLFLHCVKRASASLSPSDYGCCITEMYR